VATLLCQWLSGQLKLFDQQPTGQTRPLSLSLPQLSPSLSLSPSLPRSLSLSPLILQNKQRHSRRTRYLTLFGTKRRRERSGREATPPFYLSSSSFSLSLSPSSRVASQSHSCILLSKDNNKQIHSSDVA